MAARRPLHVMAHPVGVHPEAASPAEACCPDSLAGESHLKMSRRPGTYCLVLRATTAQRIQVGRWGTLDVHPGFYLYVGSAFGPGGLSARVSRHWRKTHARHWHVDYLREVTTPIEVWCSYGSRDFEHRWADYLGAICGVPSVPGFGCSDCDCESHLFASPGKPDFGRFCTVAGERVEVCCLRDIVERTNG